ncbi:MAG TPA: HAMP domain-containing sensor histidine kinase [Haliscomenobacter sp.]|uniref:sensor histidine kinase n=1 Tax=Haliscomenobacter sp. TaxID=2717303 RepID=UPI002B9E5979|nr:HAMP domain-containing sensor histidine kinase [Haliscomenobacter sp.]HOY16531.1 HAMP domain-containing sensor histidine kinase [Haliscomenobacter sp.]
MNAEAFKTIREQYFEKLEQERQYVFEVNATSTLSQAAKKFQLPLYFLKSVLKEGKTTSNDGNTFYAGIKYNQNNKLYLVVVTAENYYVSHHLRVLRNILFGGMFLIVLIAIYLSIYFSKHIFDPIKQITDKVKQISTENIHLRLEEKDTNNNEISELTATFNDLLNRLETAFETQKNFISNASHELSTPLTSIIGEADVALIKERTVEDYQLAMQNILQQAERLDQITKSLLFLAQTGYKGKKIIFEIVRTDEIIWEVKSLIDRLNPQNHIILDLNLLPEDHKRLKIKGNRQLLQLALANILNNACKYSHNKPVIVYLASSDNQVIIVIKDEGVGIPKEEIAYIYDPFFRASNTHLFEGYGIGLPLARNIIKLHEGQLTLTSEVNVGTTVQIKIPIARILKF